VAVEIGITIEVVGWRYCRKNGGDEQPLVVNSEVNVPAILFMFRMD
jgi:hypothetical protein